MLGVPNGQTRQVLVGQTTGNLQQILPKFLFRISLDQLILGGIVHAPQIARVNGIAAAPFARRRLQQHDTCTCFARHERRAQSCIATANDQNIKRHSRTPILELITAQSAINRNHSACDVAGQGRRQEGHHVGHVFGFAIATHGNFVVALPLTVFRAVVTENLF